jgi:hypothetical protein
MQRLFWPSRVLCLGLMLWLLPIQAAEEAAQVILARGAQALGEDGALRPLARRDKVFVGDSLSTTGNGMLQVRFVDKALLTLRENSQFRIETYAPPTDSGGNVLMHLVEGGFRTITGSIGKGSQDSYKVTSGAASIGIRGTHYEVVRESANAIVVAVWEGGIHLNTENGSLDLGPELDFSYSRVENGQAPVGLLEPPPAFEQGPAATQGNPPASAEELATNDNSTSSTLSDENSADSSASPSSLQASLSPTLDSSSIISDPSPKTAILDFTPTNPELQEVLASSDPWTTKSTVDPRLYVAEYQQFIDPARDEALIVRQNSRVILATLISPSAPALYDFASNGPVSFKVEYFIEDGSAAPPITQVQVILDKNHTSLNGLINDIQEHLNAAGVLVGVRESSLNPGHLEFFTANQADLNLHFELNNFDYSSSSALPLDVANALGGLFDGAFAVGQRDGGTRRAAVVFGQDGKPSAFLAPAINSTALPNSTAALVVGRQGAAQLTDYNPAVGGRSNISWGRWAASAANPIHLYGDINSPETITEFSDQSGYWLTAEAATATSLTGSQTFQTGATPTFIGSGSDGAVQSMSGAFSVDFNTGAISGGSLSLSTANQNWNAQFNGSYADSHATMKVTSGTISGNINCSNCVNGNLGGIFAAPGDRFVGGYDLYKSDQPSVNNQGVLLLERQ